MRLVGIVLFWSWLCLHVQSIVWKFWCRNYGSFRSKTIGRKVTLQCFIIITIVQISSQIWMTSGVSQRSRVVKMVNKLARWMKVVLEECHLNSQAKFRAYGQVCHWDSHWAELSNVRALNHLQKRAVSLKSIRVNSMIILMMMSTNEIDCCI